jgi:hypothetical protein
MAVYYYQYNLHMYDLCIFIHYLVSITQVRKETSFGLDDWCECENLLLFIIKSVGLSIYLHQQEDTVVM